MATYYIALTGNDTTGDGSEARPFRTWAKALSVAQAGGSAAYGTGDTIQALDAGPYTEGLVGNVAKQGLTLRGVEGGTVIDASASTTYGLAWYHFWDLYDLIVHSAPYEGFVAQSGSRTGRLTRCVAYNNRLAGIWTRGAPNVEVYRCKVYDNGERGLDGGTGTGLKVSHVLAYGNGRDGIYSTAADSIVEHCTVGLNSLSNTRGTYGIYAGTVRNSIAYENEIAYGIRAATYDNCLSYAATAGSTVSTDRHYTANFYSTPDVDSIEADPLFVDADGRDFHLTASSPAVWTGAASTLGITTDLEGTPLAPVPSMGVYEYVANDRVIPNPPAFSMTVTLDGQQVGVDPWSEALSPLDFAVISSLLTDRRAEPEDVLPVDDGDRRGWWGDGFGAEGPEPFGSRLWLLHRATVNQETATLARLYAEEALAWLVSEGLAESVSVTAEVATGAVIALEVSYRGTRTAEGRVLRLLVDEGAEAAPVHW